MVPDTILLTPFSPHHSPPTTGSANNGNITGLWYQDNVNTSFSHTEAYGYDGVNRLTTAAATGGSTFSQSFSYDRYGNVTCVLGSSGYCPQNSYNAASNQITTYTYDAAGNVTSDGTYTYQWDAEGRLSQSLQGPTTMHTYTYNALGQRAEDIPNASYTQEWLYDPAGQVLGNYFAYPPQPAWWHITEPALGRMFVDAENWWVGAAWIYHYNGLGTALTATDQYGNPAQDTQYYPWGQGWLNAGGWGTRWTGIYAGLLSFQCLVAPCPDQSQSRDYPDYRWLSPDPLAGSISNPQSLNRYAYVMNNPTTLTDPTGLGGSACYQYWCPPCGGNGQISCQQYYQFSGAATGWCPPAFQYCYSTMGGATIGVQGSTGIAFLQNVPVFVMKNGQVVPCNAAEISDGECQGGLGTVTLAVGTVSQQPPGQPPIFTPGPSNGSTSSSTIGPVTPTQRKQQVCHALGVAIAWTGGISTGAGLLAIVTAPIPGLDVVATPVLGGVALGTGLATIPPVILYAMYCQ